MKKGLLWGVLVCACLAICLRGGTDIEHQAFVIALGVDKRPEGQLAVTIQIPSAQPEDTPQSPSGGYQVVTVEAWTVQDALQMLRATLPRRLNFSQLLEVVIAESLVREGDFAALLEGLLSTERIRQAAELLIVESNPRAFIEAQQPYLGVRLSSSIQTSLSVFQDLGNIPDAQLGATLRSLHGAYGDVLLPYVALNQTDKHKESQKGAAVDVLAGELPFYGAYKPEYLGAALFQKDRMVGTLTGTEMQLLSFAMGRLSAFSFCIDEAYYQLSQLGIVQLSAALDPAKITIKGKVQANPMGRQTVEDAVLEAALTDSIIRVITKAQQMGVDPLGFEGQAIRGVLYLQDWSVTAWEEAYGTASIEVKIHMVFSEEH